jgi:hypothetical protein
MQEHQLSRAVRVALAVFVVSAVANVFFWWSFPAWFSLWGPPDGLVSPVVDRWIVTPAAMVVYALQYPSYRIAERSRWWAHGPIAPLVGLASVVTTALYAPVIVWALRWREQRATRRAA